MKNSICIDTEIITILDLSTRKTRPLEDILEDLVRNYEIKEGKVYGISYKLLLRLIDACFEADSDLICEEDSFGDFGISLSCDILPFLKEHHNQATLYGVIDLHPDGSIRGFYLMGVYYEGRITKNILVDFYTAFRFSEDIYLGDNYLDAKF